MLKRAAIRRPLGFRVAAVASIAAVHVLAVAALSHIREQAPEALVAEAVQVAFIQESTPAAPPTPRVSLESARVPEIRLPSVEIPVEVTVTPPAPTAITVVAATAATAAPPAPEVEADNPVEVQSVDYVRRPTPRYPPMASRLHAHGTVYLRVVVDAEGHARDVRVHRSSGFKLLDDAARNCVQDALFKPHREGGRARSAVVIVPIDFLPNMRTASR